jgi:class 3 adenylate cyclase
MPSHIDRGAAPAVPATSVVIDLRNFSPNLDQAAYDADGVNEFCHFLADFYGHCLRACLTSLPPQRRARPPVHLTSTGDGVLIVFHEPGAHHRHALLAAMALHRVLDVRCDAYNRRFQPSSPTSFGIGVESGFVNRVRARALDSTGVPVLDTFIGDCINVASRLEGVTKTLDRARCIVGPRTNQLLVEDLHGVDYDALKRAGSSIGSDTVRLAAQDQMVRLNRALCLSYLHDHLLKGVATAQALFRVSQSAAQPGNDRFEALLDALTDGDAAWRASLRALLESAEHGPNAPERPGGTDAAMKRHSSVS